MASVDTVIYKWRIRCVTENEYVYTWGDTMPTKCPNNTTHTIDTLNMVVIDQLDQLVIKIKEENIPTGGNFRCISRSVTATPNCTNTEDFSFPYPICVYSVTFVSKPENEGDVMNVEIGPNTTIGIVTQNVSSSTKLFRVSPTVVQNIMVGYNVAITDGINYDNLGDCIAIDYVNSTITVLQAPTHNYSVFSPTYVMMSVRMMDNYEIGPAWMYEIGKSKIGGSYIPANVRIRLTYVNKSMIDTKRMIFKVEHTY